MPEPAPCNLGLSAPARDPSITGTLLAPCMRTADGPVHTWRPVGGWGEDPVRQAEVALAASATGQRVDPPFARSALSEWDAAEGTMELALWRAARPGPLL